MHFPGAVSSIGMALVVLVQGYSMELGSSKKSVLTTTRQIEFPGMVLGPGTYVVRLHDEGDEKRSVVQVLNRAEDQVLTTVIAVPDHRVRPDDGAEFIYHPVNGAGPRPLRAWYYANDLVGWEFVYPTARAKDLAKAADGRVMACNDKDGPIVAVTPNGKEIVIDEPLQTARQKPQ